MTASPPASQPGRLVWVLTGAKSGDNAQVLRAAQALALPFVTKAIALLPQFETAKPAVRPSLHHVDREASAPLAAPWPDLVIVIGRRLSMVALWIKQQSQGQTRIALFNAPKGSSDDFDLIVAPVYYTLTEQPRLLRIGLPLIALDEGRIAAARQQFAAIIGTMPKPMTALLLGGSTSNLRLSPRDAIGIFHQVRGGAASIYVSTSRRTGPHIADALAPLLSPADRLYRWTPATAGNPFFGLAAHADQFVITGDSLSMIVEIARLGRPLAIAELPAINRTMAKALAALGWKNPVNALGRRLQAIGTKWQPRDLQGLYTYLYSKRLAVPLGAPPVTQPPQVPDDLATVANRLRALLGLECLPSH